jgi:putative ABC transport system permease protein
MTRNRTRGGMSPLVWFEGFWQDLRFAARALRRSPGYTAAAFVTLALGIGASTAIFSVLYGVLLRPLPYLSADRLALVQTRNRTTGAINPSGFSGPDFDDWRRRLRSFESLALCSSNIFALDRDQGSETVKGAFVSREFFAVLGVYPQLGRVPSGTDEIVISDDFWRRRFDGDPRIVGRRLRLNGGPATIVGVAGPGITFPTETRSSLGAPPEPSDLWAPFDAAPWAKRRAFAVGQLVGRIASGRTAAQVTADVDAVAQSFRRDYPDWDEGRDPVVVSLPAELYGGLRPALWLLFGAVGGVLLVACANVTNLLLVRQTSRGGETAVRIWLGAPVSRLVSHVFSEAALLASGGGVLGVALAVWVVALLRWFEPADLPRLDAIHVDLPVLFFAAGVSALCAIMSVAVPAWRLIATGAEVARDAEGRRYTSGRSAQRIRSGLVVTELAVSLMLLVAATLLARSFARLAGTDIGVDTDKVVAVELNLAMGRTLSPDRQIQLADRLVEATRRLPGVRAAAAANGLPPNRSRMMMSFNLPDWRTGRPVQRDIGMLNPTPQYFSALGIPLVRGRLFSAADGANAPQIAIVNVTAANRLFGALDVVGRTLPGSRKAGEKFTTIVGVVGDVKYSGLGEAVGETVYVPFPQYPFRNMMLIARTLGDPRQVSASLTRLVHSIDPEITVGAVRTLDDIVWDAVARPRFRTFLLSSLAALALALAVVGLYGVAAYAVNQRRVEIGVRLAFGARPGQIVAMIVRDALRLAIVGAVIGLLAAALFARTLAVFLYGVTTSDAPSFVLAAAALVLVAAGAACLAARKAAHLDPAVALRAE